MISGILASPGIALGRVFLLKEDQIIPDSKKIIPNKINKEIKRFLFGKKKFSKQISLVKNKAKKNICEDQLSILESYNLILEDKKFEDNVISLIKNDLYSADSAVFKIIKDQIKKLENINNDYLQERISDLIDFRKRLLSNILSIKLNDLSSINKEIILVAADLLPSEIMQIDLKNILGIVTDLGSKNSHTSIIARSLEIPTIVCTKNITKKVKHGDFIIVDAINNQIYINPDLSTIKKIRNLKLNLNTIKSKSLNIKNIFIITKDEHKVEICANINTRSDIELAKKNGAKSIGLYRTEFLFMNRNSLPSEEEQFTIYKDIAESMTLGSVTIRTVDIGGDKFLPYLNLPKENNPYLGFRAIRIGLAKKEILHVQLRAILRASKFGEIRIMYPMISSVEEVRKLKFELSSIKKQLKNEGKFFDENIKVGIMIETPAAAILSNALSKEVDFFSIGTNDLTQYTLAVDRDNMLVSHMYDPITPSVIFLIKNIIDSSHSVGKYTGICGELAGIQYVIPLLLGMELDTFSVCSSLIPSVKKIVLETNFKKAKNLAKQVLSISTKKELKDLLTQFFKNKLYI